jgi:hypothetical protein
VEISNKQCKQCNKNLHEIRYKDYEAFEDKCLDHPKLLDIKVLFCPWCEIVIDSTIDDDTKV